QVESTGYTEPMLRPGGAGAQIRGRAGPAAGLPGGKAPPGRWRALAPLPVTAGETLIDPGRVCVPGEQGLCGTGPARVPGRGRAARPPEAGPQGLLHHPLRFVAATEQVADLVFQHREQVHAPLLALVTGRGELGVAARAAVRLRAACARHRRARGADRRAP